MTMSLDLKSAVRALAVLPLALFVIGSPPACAQPGTPPAADTQDAAKQAFEALPEAERKAIQDGLIWTGDYKGIADGRFGKGTRDAMAAFALRSKMPGDGTLDQRGRMALAAAAQRSRAAVRFSVVTDERSGIRIGVPLKLLPKITATKDGSHYGAADNAATLDMAAFPEGNANLAQRFETLRNDTAQRKITYKILRPDFFVIVGETGGSLFYTRYARGERAGEKILASYTLSYPAAARKTFDMIAIAVANSFEPFAANAQTANTQTAKTDLSEVAAKPALQTGERQSPAGSPAKPYLMANGVIVGAGLVLTSLPASGCRDLQIASHSVKIALQEKSNGLALLQAGTLTGRPVALGSGELKADMPVVMLAYADKAAAHPGTASDTGDELHAALLAAPGQVRQVRQARPGSAGLRVFAAAEGVHAGSAVFDRSGALVGLLAGDAGPDTRIEGVAPVANRPLIGAEALTGFLAEQHVQGKPAAIVAPQSVGAIVAENRSALVPVYCVP